MPRKAPPEDKILNPATGRYVLKTGAIGKKILAGMKEGEVPVQADEKILNPATGRYVLKRGAIGKKILAQMAAAAKPAPAPAAKQMKTPEEAKQIIGRAIASKKAKATLNEAKYARDFKENESAIEKIYDEIIGDDKEKKELLKDYIYISFYNNSTLGNKFDMGNIEYNYEYSENRKLTYYNRILSIKFNLYKKYPEYLEQYKSNYKDFYHEQTYRNFILEYFKAAITYYYLLGIKKDINVDIEKIDKNFFSEKKAIDSLNNLFDVNYEYKQGMTYKDIFKMYLDVFYYKFYKPNMVEIHEVIIEKFEKYREFEDLYESLTKTYRQEAIRYQENIDKEKKAKEEERRKRYERKAYNSEADTDEEGDVIQEVIKEKYDDIMRDIIKEMPNKVFKKWFDKYKSRYIKTTYLKSYNNYQNFKKIILFIIYHIRSNNKEIIDYMFHRDILKHYYKFEDFNTGDGFTLLMKWCGINTNNLRQYGSIHKAQRELLDKAITKFKKGNQENDYMSFFKSEVMNYVIDKYKKE